MELWLIIGLEVGVAELGFFLAAGYLAALGGEEIVKMDMR